MRGESSSQISGTLSLFVARRKLHASRRRHSTRHLKPTTFSLSLLLVGNFRKLRVWQQAHKLVLETYQLSAALPMTERYGLQSQIRRAAVSIPTNVVEGSVRRSDLDFRRFARIALGSANELEYLLMLTIDLGYLDDADTAPLISETRVAQRMLSGLISTLGNKG